MLATPGHLMKILRSHLGPTEAELMGEEDWVCGGGGDSQGKQQSGFK